MADHTSTKPDAITIACQCGDVSFTRPGNLLPIVFCHCTSCRKRSTTAFGTSVFFPTDQLFPLSPELEAKLTVYAYPTDKGNTMKAYFCSRCGVTVFQVPFQPDGTMAAKCAIKGGVVEDDLEWGKGFHVYTRSAVVPIPEGQTKFETGPPSIQ